MLGTQRPQTTLPLGSVFSFCPLQGQHIPGGLAKTSLKHVPDLFALQGIVKFVVERIDIRGKLALLQEVSKRVLVGVNNKFRSDLEPPSQFLGKVARRIHAEAIVAVDLRKQARVVPKGGTVSPPITREGPPWQRLAGIPLPLSIVEQAALAKFLAQAKQEFARHAFLSRSQRRRVPLFALHVVDGDERGFAAHRQAHITCDKLLVDALSQLVEALPLFLGVRLGNAGGLEDARDPHFVMKLHLAGAHQPRNRRRRARLGCCRQGNMPFPGK